MTMRISVCYGEPEDPAAFDDHYTSVHIPLTNKVPGLTSFTWGKVRSMNKSQPPYYAVASLHFADATALEAGLASPEMAAAGKDLRNFATGGVTMYITNEEPAGP